MLGAISFDTLAFIALVLVASFFRWISKEGDKAKRKSEQGGGAPVKTTRLPSRGETDEERVRRFLEALGQPTSSKPPARIERRLSVPSEKRVVPQRGRTVLPPLPPLTTVPPPLPTETETPSPALPVSEPAVSRAAVPMISAKQEILPSVVFPETSPRPAVYQGVVTLLSSTGGLRDAVILREIFGPPRSLQEIEF
jgi:hypothetical protein